MAELQSGEGRMIIDSVVWAQYMNVTDTQQTDSHVAVANSALRTGVGRQKCVCIGTILTFRTYGVTAAPARCLQPLSALRPASKVRRNAQTIFILTFEKLSAQDCKTCSRKQET